MTRVGVIDVGTNSVRLLVADGEPLADVRRDLTITRLGEGVDGARRLAPEPMRRTLAAIAGYVEDARRADVAAIRIAATSAVRDAANRDDFLAAVRETTGLDVEVLSGEQEARRSFAGATIASPVPGVATVVDIGGGSTELVSGDGRAEKFLSLDIGSVRLTERHVRSDPPAEPEVAAVRADADAHLTEAIRLLGDSGGALVGVAGTVTTLAATILKLDAYDRAKVHHTVLTRAQVAAARTHLAAMTSAQRRALPVMPPGREDVIVAGAVILEQVMDGLGFDRCVVSETDILDGIALELLRARSG